MCVRYSGQSCIVLKEYNCAFCVVEYHVLVSKIATVHRRIQGGPVGLEGGPVGPGIPFFEHPKKIHCNCMLKGDKGIAKKQHKVKIVAYYIRIL